MERRCHRAWRRRAIVLALLLAVGVAVYARGQAEQWTSASEDVVLATSTWEATRRLATTLINGHPTEDVVRSPPMPPPPPPPPPRDVRYHLYDPSAFAMYRKCKHASVQAVHHAKFSVDRLFLEHLIDEGKSVPPDQAELFVIPVVYSDSVRGLCGNHKENHRQLVETIKASPHFQRSRGADHLLVASDWQAAGYLDREEEDPLSLEKTVIGHRPIPLMKHVPSFSVGYGTAPALMRLWAVHNYSSQVHHYLEGKREEEGKPQEGVTSRSHRKLLSTGGQADDNDDDDIEGNDFIDAEHGWRAFGWDEYRGNDGDGGGEGGGDAFGLNDDMPTLLPGPKHSNRRYLFSALMQLDGRPAYKTRRTFMCSWQTLPARIKHTPGYTNAEKRKAIYTLRHRFPIFLHRASKFINRIGFVNRATIPIFNPCTSNMGTWDQRHHSHVPDGAMKLLLHPPGKYGRLSHHRKSVHPAEHANHTELTPEELEAGLRQDRQPVTKAVKYLAQSRAVLSIRGDTPMTDRDSLVFETLSLKLELEDNIERLLPMLPFTDVVPWRDLILAIKVRHPWTMAEDILYAMQGISRAEWNQRVKLMAQYRKDVLWAMPGIRTHQNVMRNALAAAKAWKKPVAAPQRQQPQRIPWYKSARGDSPRTIPAEAPKLAVARASLPDLPRQRLGVNGASSARVKKWERFHQEQEETVRGSRVESLKQELRKRVQGKPPRFYTAAERERYAKQIRSTGRTGWMR